VLRKLRSDNVILYINKNGYDMPLR